MLVQDFPVTELFGCQPGYPLNQNLCPPGQGFHNGIDYGCPTGTPIVVNGVTIGISGATGEVTGPHCHVGRWIGGGSTDPGVGNGFKFNSAIVTEINEDPTNGKYVRVQGDGASWVYLHMSDNSKVGVGQILQGGDEMTATNLNQARMLLYFIRGYNGHNGTPNALNGEADNIAQGWVGKDLGEAMNSWYNDSGSQQFREVDLPAVYKAAETPSGVKPYDGPALFVKE